MKQRKPVKTIMTMFVIQILLLTALSFPVSAGVTGTEGGHPSNFSIGAGGRVQFDFTYSDDYAGARPTVIVEGPMTGQFPSPDLTSEITWTQGTYWLSGITILPDAGYAIQDVTVDTLSKGPVATIAIPHTADLIVVGDPNEPGNTYVAAGSYSDFTVTFTSVSSSIISSAPSGSMAESAEATALLGSAKKDCSWLLWLLILLILLLILFFILLFLKRRKKEKKDSNDSTKNATAPATDIPPDETSGGKPADSETDEKG